ncbi:LOW QUALITY PROTEIN: hypothetical protein Cgig2_004431 [Carnegiea gigantea]|uniref:Peptidase C1A papain C-terminal domain-containing protein n=1 Tax=Carnegiea gigantea TaxID=171969 RepID=A0A9Q1Q7J2_9CARY|nr:LOW QUALITY PROTEIN: hypothetical protein Cgig2_004431 [Carnegiea gigantea]
MCSRRMSCSPQGEQKDKPYKLKLNKFADLTNHEFRRPLCWLQNTPHRMFHGQRTMKLHKGAVTPSRTKANVQLKASTNSNKEASVPSVDTSSNQGCNGVSWSWHSSSSRKKAVSPPRKTILTKLQMANVMHKDEFSSKSTIDGMRTYLRTMRMPCSKLVANQPVSVAIDAGVWSMQGFTGECGTDLDHGVVAGMELLRMDQVLDSEEHSWGEEWGEKGYIRMQRAVLVLRRVCVGLPWRLVPYQEIILHSFISDDSFLGKDNFELWPMMLCIEAE